MPKVNVYVPDELLARVRAEEISLSPVCQRALEAEVESRELARSATKNLRAVARRLQATEETVRAHAFQQGYALGMAWGRDSATVGELRRVERAANRDLYVESAQMPTLIPYLIDNMPNVDWDPDEALDGEESEFDRGVLTGAAEVYRNVRPLLEKRSQRQR